MQGSSTPEASLVPALGGNECHCDCSDTSIVFHWASCSIVVWRCGGPMLFIHCFSLSLFLSLTLFLISINSLSLSPLTLSFVLLPHFTFLSFTTHTHTHTHTLLQLSLPISATSSCLHWRVLPTPLLPMAWGWFTFIWTPTNGGWVCPQTHAVRCTCAVLHFYCWHCDSKLSWLSRLVWMLY